MRKKKKKRSEPSIIKWALSWIFYLLFKSIPYIAIFYFVTESYRLYKTGEYIEEFPFYYFYEDADNYPGEEYPDADEIVENSYEVENGTHHVDPHYVEGYERSDGTYVEGYWRGGEEGYERSNPDGDPSNNLDYGEYDYGDDSGDDGTWYDSEGDGYDGIGEEIGEYLFGN
jgi:hypothetical protein